MTKLYQNYFLILLNKMEWGMRHQYFESSKTLGNLQYPVFCIDVFCFNTIQVQIQFMNLFPSIIVLC